MAFRPFPARMPYPDSCLDTCVYEVASLGEASWGATFFLLLVTLFRLTFSPLVVAIRVIVIFSIFYQRFRRASIFQSDRSVIAKCLLINAALYFGLEYLATQYVNPGLDAWFGSDKSSWINWVLQPLRIYIGFAFEFPSYKTVGYLLVLVYLIMRRS